MLCTTYSGPVHPGHTEASHGTIKQPQGALVEGRWYAPDLARYPVASTHVCASRRLRSRYPCLSHDPCASLRHFCHTIRVRFSAKQTAAHRGPQEWRCVECRRETDCEVVRAVSWLSRRCVVVHSVRRTTDGFNVYDPSLKPLPGTIYIGHLTETGQQIWCQCTVHLNSVAPSASRLTFLCPVNAPLAQNFTLADAQVDVIAPALPTAKNYFLVCTCSLPPILFQSSRATDSHPELQCSARAIIGANSSPSTTPLIPVAQALSAPRSP